MYVLRQLYAVSADKHCEDSDMSEYVSRISESVYVYLVLPMLAYSKLCLLLSGIILPVDM